MKFSINIEVDIDVADQDAVFDLAKSHPQLRPQLIEFITESRWAYRWACEIGDEGIMRDRVTESQYAYYWARYFGDKEIMRDRVTESEWAFNWARYLGDFEIMRDRVTDSELIVKWNSLFCNNPELQITTK